MPLRKNNDTINGLAISPGLGMGRAYIYHDILQRKNEYYRVRPSEVEEEWQRIENAIGTVRSNLREQAERIKEQVKDGAAEILLVQEAMLGDEELLKDLRNALKEERINAEYIVKEVLLRWENRIEQSETDEGKQKHEDVADLARRLLRELEGISAHALEEMPAGSVLVARRLLPSDTVFLSRLSTAAVVVEYGGRVSHAAILTRELGIPGVAQVENITARVSPGDTVYVDGDDGKVVLRPDTKRKRTMFQNIESRWDGQRAARAHRQEPAFFRKKIIKVMANVGTKEDVMHARANGADGIGLYRMEHLFLSRNSPPSEDEIADSLRQALEPMKGKPVTLRLLDAGGDKDLPFLTTRMEQNPFLGEQGVRILRNHSELLNTQLRAIIRISREHDIRILVPMVTLSEDIKAVREALMAAAAEMKPERIPRIGAMIETPAAALCTAKISRHSDFLSIGTNDLTQYTMAADRENPKVSRYFIEDHPAVMRLLKIVIDEAGSRPVSVCGEMAGRAETLQKLMSLGIKEVSVAPVLIPEVKEHIRTSP